MIKLFYSHSSKLVAKLEISGLCWWSRYFHCQDQGFFGFKTLLSSFCRNVQGFPYSTVSSNKMSLNRPQHKFLPYLRAAGFSVFTAVLTSRSKPSQGDKTPAGSIAPGVNAEFTHSHCTLKHDLCGFERDFWPVEKWYIILFIMLHLKCFKLKFWHITPFDKQSQDNIWYFFLFWLPYKVINTSLMPLWFSLLNIHVCAHKDTYILFET